MKDCESRLNSLITQYNIALCSKSDVSDYVEVLTTQGYDVEFIKGGRFNSIVGAKLYEKSNCIQ